jgi:hypothetical protein
VDIQQGGVYDQSICILDESLSFRAKHAGHCPIGPDGSHPILEGDLIVKLEKPFVIGGERLSRSSRIYLATTYVNYVHEECWERYQDDKDNGE